MSESPWFARIATAREKGGFFTEEDFARAMDWVTCACGEQDPAIPRGDLNEPLDKDLFDLGDMFSTAIKNDAINHAESILQAIQARAAIVLAETLESAPQTTTEPSTNRLGGEAAEHSEPATTTVSDPVSQTGKGDVF